MQHQPPKSPKYPTFQVFYWKDSEKSNKQIHHLKKELDICLCGHLDIETNVKGMFNSRRVMLKFAVKILTLKRQPSQVKHISQQE